MVNRKRHGALPGFTIVELIIVIVIIAILAAITIASYNGMQQRARNAQIISGVRAYQKALIEYATVNGSYPTQDRVCLGANYPSSSCWNGPHGTFYTNSGMDSALAPFLANNKPTLSTHILQITNTPDYRLGALYVHNSTSDIFIDYYLEGQSQRCLDGASGINEMEGTQCKLYLPPV